MNDYLKQLSDKIYAKRHEGQRRYPRSLRDVANEAHVSPATLSRIDNGKPLDLETFRKLCIWLDADANELLGITGRKDAAI